MSTNAQRGRKVQRRKASLTPFYIAIGVVAAVGLVLLGYTFFAQGGGDIPDVVIEQPAPITAPVGQTAEGYWYKGSDDAPVKVIEYADFQCPGCRAFATGASNQIEQEYINTGRVQLIFREFPLPQHQQAVPAAMAARCAGDQNQFWAMHDVLFARQNEWSNNRRATNYFAGYAQALGLDAAALQQCVADNTHRAAIDASVQAGSADQVPATPSFLVDGQLTSAEQLVAAIDAALAAKGQ
jgi:protein-disulfide isomerase